MFLTVVFYFAVLTFLYFVVLPKESSRVSPKKYTRSEFLKYRDCLQVPADWVSVESIKASIQPKLISNQFSRPISTSDVSFQQINSIRQTKFFKPRISKAISSFESNKENQVPTTKINENFIQKPKQEFQPSLSSFILKELESSVYELTKKPGHLNPYATEFTFNSFSNS